MQVTRMGKLTTISYMDIKMKSTIIIGIKIIFKMVPEGCVQLYLIVLKGTDKSMNGKVFHNRRNMN